MRFTQLLRMVESGRDLGARKNRNATVVGYECSKRRRFVVDYDNETGDAFRIQRVGQRRVIHYA